MARKALKEEVKGTEADDPVHACLEAKLVLRKACRELAAKGISRTAADSYREASGEHHRLYQALTAEEKSLVHKLFGEEVGSKGKR